MDSSLTSSKPRYKRGLFIALLLRMNRLTSKRHLSHQGNGQIERFCRHSRQKTFDLMTSAKGLSRFTTPLILGISLISLSGLDVHAQDAYELPQQQNQREINRLKQQLDPQRNEVPQRSMPPSSAPGSVTAFDARSIQRSVNLARDTAIKMNGGLSQYRPAGCMFRGSDRNPCITRRGPQGILFEIPGGPPGWEEARALPSIMTVLLISPDGRSLLQTISNSALPAQQPNPNIYP